MRAVWDAVSLKGKHKGERDCENRNRKLMNKKGKKKYTDSLDKGDIVMKKIMKKGQLGERWEGPYEVLEYDGESGGYRIKERGGAVLKDLFPIEFLWRIEKFEDKQDETESYEVEKILDPRGKAESREYLVKWKDYEKSTWVKQERFNTTGCITEYWKKKREETKKKEKDKENQKPMEDKNVRRSARIRNRRVEY